MQENWSQELIRIHKNIDLNIIRTGTGDKPSLILAHGLSDDAFCWEPLASDLEDNYDIIMYDAYGHGRSSRVDPEIRFDLVEDLHDLIEILKLEKPNMIGHSMGAYTLARFAAKYPDIPSAIVLEDPPWTVNPLSAEQAKEMRASFRQNNQMNQEKSLKALVKFKKNDSPNWDARIYDLWAQAKHAFDLSFLDQYPFKQEDWRNTIKSINVPTLIIAGDPEKGAYVTPKMGITAVTLLKQGEFGHISGCGHCVRYEQYQPYLSMVKLFLKRNLPS